MAAEDHFPCHVVPCYRAKRSCDAALADWAEIASDDDGVHDVIPNLNDDLQARQAMSASGWQKD